MTAQTPEQVAAAWAQKLAASTDKMVAGANAVTVAPGVLAARQADTWANNTVAAKPKFAKNVAAVTKDEWLTAYTTKGIPRVATGAQAAQTKFTNFMSKLLPFQATAVNSLPARGTYEQNKARMNAWVDKMHSFNYKGGS